MIKFHVRYFIYFRGKKLSQAQTFAIFATFAHFRESLAPQKIIIQKRWLSGYRLEIANEHNIATGTAEKLVTSLMDKYNYVIHYRNLQQCLELGMKF